ncbi:MAG: type VI secretion system baseplate subunit TssK [Gemmatimonadota bacterium]
MNGVRVPVDAVQWHEGMLLAPQHFQQSTLRAEQLVNYHVLTASPYHWGIRRLRIDPVALVNGTFRVTDLEAIMPDGLPVAIDPDYPEPLEVDLTESPGEFRRGPVRVHLAIPAHRGEAAAAGMLARYLSVAGRAVRDDNTGEGDLKIPRLRPRLTLLLGERPPEKFASFPIAEVRFQDETYALTDFISPRLIAASGTPLLDEVAAVAKRVREKASFLSEKVRASSTVEKRPLLQDMQTSVRTLVAALPPLEAVVAAGVVHPFTLYLKLSGLAGHLAGLGATQVPPAFPKYDHDDLRASFAPLLAFANRMLDSVQESYTALPFAHRDGRFSLVVAEEQMSPTLVLGVVAPTGVSEADVAEWFDAAQIGSASRMASIRDRRIRGAPRQRIDEAEELDLVPGRGVVLFAVKAEAEMVIAGEELVVVHPGDPEGRKRPAEVTLYVSGAARD